MALWVLGLAGLLLVWLSLMLVSRMITASIRETERLLENKLDQFSASAVTLRQEVSGLRNDLGDHLGRIEGFLKPVYYTAEMHVEEQDPERLATASNHADRLLESVDRFKQVLVRNDLNRAREEETWRKFNAAERAKVHQE